MNPSCDDAARRGDEGFALLIVLWSLALLALLVGHLISAGRTEVRIAANVVGSARAEAAAEGAVYDAVFRLADRSEQRWAPDRSTYWIRLGGVPVQVRIQSVSGRINPNVASAGLLIALVRVCGVDPVRAASLAGAIVTRRRTGAPFQSLDDLGEIPGMTPDVLQRLRPHLSLFQQTEPDARYADSAVRAALADWRGAAAVPEAGSTALAGIQTVIIDAAATTDTASFVLRAVVRVDDVPPRGYTVLAWDRRIEAEE